MESNYRSTVRFPEASLFIRLRELLRHEGLIQDFSATSFDELRMGALVEFSGFVSPNPAFQLRHFAQQMAPLLEPFAAMGEKQAESTLAILDKSKPNQPIFLGEEMIENPTQAQLNLMKSALRISIEKSRNDTEITNSILDGIEKLMAHDHLDRVIFDTGVEKAISLLYPDFARDRRIQDIHYAHWSCIGKVIGKINRNERYNLLRGLPAGYLIGNEKFSEMMSTASREFNFEMTADQVEGPTFIIATLAIFA